MKNLLIAFLTTYAFSVCSQETDERTEIVTYGQKVFMAVDLPSEFPGGSIAEQKYLGQNLIVPDNVGDVNGKVFFEFIVETDGQLSNIKLVRGLVPSVDSVAMNVVRNMPKWEPAFKNGIPVRHFVQYSISVTRLKKKN